MQIKEVCILTGLSAKAIRLYESKGLVSVERAANAYREYTDEKIERLSAIRRFRMTGVSLADIRLWADGLFDAESLFKKRLQELSEENGKNKEQEKLCRAFLMQSDESALSVSQETAVGALFDDPELLRPSALSEGHRLSLGIDIGTTTISAAIADLDEHCQAACYTLPNKSAVKTDESYRHEQDAAWIADKLSKFLESVIGAFPGICSIGVTGQMHGIVYTNTHGNAVSPLYTWQDTRAAAKMPDGKTYSEDIKEKTGYTVMPGYGFATHYYNRKNGLVPESAAYLCTIGDYAVMRMTGNTRPLIHASNAASLGFFDVKTGLFDREALKKIGIRADFLPEMAMGEPVAGFYRGIPVTVAIGDNQAAFFGSVRDEANDLSVNYGTGSQISLCVNADFPTPLLPLELRPYVEGQALLNGSALCGGRAYAFLEKFFRAYLDTGEEQYEKLNALAEKALKSGEVLKVRTTFCGTRKDPSIRGAIENIGEENFTPAALARGVLEGMVDELYDMYEKSGVTMRGRLVASGNAVQKNPTLCKLLSERFGMPLFLPALREEAAFGASLAAAHFALALPLNEVKSCIPYHPENPDKK